jgi:HEAT repeat protein
MNQPAAREVLADAMQHPVGDVRVAAAIALAKAKDVRAVRGLLDAIRDKRFKEIHKANVSLADFGEPALPILLSCARNQDEDPIVRSWIAAALGSMKNDAVLPPLRELLLDVNPDLRTTAVRALSNFDKARSWILECLHDPDIGVVETAIHSLEEFSGPDIVAGLCMALQHQSAGVRRAAVWALRKVGDATATPALVGSLHDEDETVRWTAADALRNFGDASAIPALLTVIHDDSRDVRSHSLDALIRIGGATAVAGLLAELRGNNRRDRANAAYALGGIGDGAAVPALLEALRDKEESVRVNAARALGHIRAESGADDLIALLKNDDEEDELRQAASDALREIGTSEARAAARAWERQKKREP